MKNVCDSDNNLEFIGKSKIDDGLVYKITIPDGFVIVPPITDLV